MANSNPVGVPQSEEAPKLKEWMREAEREIVADVRRQCRLWAGVYVAWNDDPDRWAKIMARHEAEAGPVEAPLNKVQEWMRRAARHWSNVDNIVEEYAEIIAEEYWKAPGAQPLHVRSDREKEIVRKLRAEHDRLRSAAESSTEGGALYAMAAKLNAVASEIERGE